MKNEEQIKERIQRLEDAILNDTAISNFYAGIPVTGVREARIATIALKWVLSNEDTDL